MTLLPINGGAHDTLPNRLSHQPYMDALEPMTVLHMDSQPARPPPAVPLTVGPLPVPPQVTFVAQGTQHHTAPLPATLPNNLLLLDPSVDPVVQHLLTQQAELLFCQDHQSQQLLAMLHSFAIQPCPVDIDNTSSCGAMVPAGHLSAKWSNSVAAQFHGWAGFCLGHTMKALPPFF